MAEFKFKFIYKCIIICIDCFVVNKNFVLLYWFISFSRVSILIARQLPLLLLDIGLGLRLESD